MPKVNFQFGRKETSVKDYAIISIVLYLLAVIFSKLLRTTESEIYSLIDDFQRNHWPNWLNGLIDKNKLNDYFINTPELLDARIQRDVQRALSSYEQSVGTQENITIGEGAFFEAEPDGSNAQILLGGEIGIKGDWTD